MTILSISDCKLLDTPARDGDRVYKNSDYSKPGIFTSNERDIPYVLRHRLPTVQ